MRFWSRGRLAVSFAILAVVLAACAGATKIAAPSDAGGGSFSVASPADGATTQSDSIAVSGTAPAGATVANSTEAKW